MRPSCDPQARYKPGDWDVLRWITLVLPLCYRCSTVVSLVFPRPSSLVRPMQSHVDFGSTTVSPPKAHFLLTALVRPLFKSDRIFLPTSAGGSLFSCFCRYRSYSLS